MSTGPLKPHVDVLRNRLRRSARRAWLRAPLRAKATARREVPVVVSLSSWPGRIETTWMAVESILRQSDPPDKVVLTVTDEDFPDRQLPQRLRRQETRGLEVLWAPRDLGSYKKLLPILERIGDEAVIVTVDDDNIYPRWLLGALLHEHRATPEQIIGHRGSWVQLAGERKLGRYVDKPPASPETPSNRVLLTGVGGILYPPGSLPPTVFDYETAAELSPSNDDVWFYAMALLAGTPVRCTGVPESELFEPIPGTENVALYDENVHTGRNDVQLHAVIDHFNLWAQLEVARAA